MRRDYWIVILVTAGLVQGSCDPCWAAVYRVDKDRTRVSFDIRSFMSRTHGSFHDFEGSVTYDPGAPGTWASKGTIQVRSIDTKNAERERHLLSKDFFDVDRFPTIFFRTAEIVPGEKNSARIQGFLKIRGIEKSVTVDVQKIELSRDDHGVEHLNFTAAARIDRRDFGLTYSSSGPGQVLLGDEVTLIIQADAIRL